jgi:hypothetical protein
LFHAMSNMSFMCCVVVSSSYVCGLPGDFTGDIFPCSKLRVASRVKKLLCMQAGYFFFRPGIGESAFIFPPLVHVWYVWWHSRSSALSSLWYLC